MSGFLSREGFPALASAPLGFEYFQLAFHGTRETSIARRFVKSALARFRPKVVVASDVSLCAFRAILLEAREQQVKTVSVNHGYYMSDIGHNFFVADECCASGPSVQCHMALPVDVPQNIVVTGNAVLADVASGEGQNPVGRPRIVIVTTSFLGLWSSLSSVEADAGSGVERLASLLSENGGWDIVIKSHPVADFHVLYDDIVARVARQNLTHIRTCWSNKDFAVCAAAVVCGGVTGAILQLQRAGVPIVYLADRMTEVLSREWHFDYAGCGCVASSPEDAKESVVEVLAGGAYRSEVIERGRRFLNGYRGDPANAMPAFTELLARLAHTTA